MAVHVQVQRGCIEMGSFDALLKLFFAQVLLTIPLYLTWTAQTYFSFTLQPSTCSMYQMMAVRALILIILLNKN